jgi:hypothetical protein
MQKGNRNALALMLPFIFVIGIFLSSPGKHSNPNAGAFTIAIIFSFFTFIGSFIYLIVKNANYLNYSAPIQWFNRHKKPIRIILAILLLFTIYAKLTKPQIHAPSIVKAYAERMSMGRHELFLQL